jgi:hypothetical protein
MRFDKRTGREYPEPQDDIIATAIKNLRKTDMTDCEIGHRLVLAGADHLERSLRDRGLLHELPEQISHAHRFLGERLKIARGDKLMDTPRGSAAMQ